MARLHIGEQIRIAREAAGMTQQDVADKARLARNYVSMVELGHKSPTMNVLERISRAIKVKASLLVARAERAAGRR